MAKAIGSFEVRLAPLAAHEGSIGRMTIDKEFHGDLEGTSRGEMLSAMTSVQGSAGYVAMEKVTGTLAGRSGTFVLQHTATMHRGVPSLSITVVPDSGTEGLTGIRGTFNIIIADGKHAYELDYELV